MRTKTLFSTVLPALLLSGCGDLQRLLDLKESLDDYTNTTVVSASILGVAPSSTNASTSRSP